jgi:hypothetical protein
MKKRLHIVTKLLVGILAFQVLNFSVSNTQIYEDAYQYANSTTTGSDPTESMIELIVEARYGQLDMFTYKSSPETTKNTGKAFYYQPDIISEEAGDAISDLPSTRPSFPHTAEKIVGGTGKINVPPPEI